MGLGAEVENIAKHFEERVVDRFLCRQDCELMVVGVVNGTLTRKMTLRTPFLENLTIAKTFSVDGSRRCTVHSR